MKSHLRKEDKLAGRTYYTDDPVGDWDRYVAQAEEDMKDLPVCDECGEHIYDGYELPDGTIYCDDCMRKFAKEW